MADVIEIELDAQYRQLREECGVLDRSARGKLLVSGPDAAEFLQGQITNDVEALDSGEGHHAALLDRKGHIQADMRVLRLEAGEFWLDTEPEALEALQSHLEMYKIGRDVQVANLTTERTIVSLIGPRSVEIAGTAALPAYAGERATVHGVPCLVVGTPEGLDLIAEAGDAERLRANLTAAGAVKVDPRAAEILRIEAGRPRFGAEMSSAIMPAEAGIVEDAVSFEKGCYIGQEPVARLHYRGRPNRQLRGLALSAPIEAGSPLLLGEKEVGRVGSTCVSPTRGPIGLAIIRREAEPGAELTVGEDEVTARVVDLPFG